MNLSKFEQQHFAQFRPIFLDEKDKIRVNPPREKIPRTTQVKRMFAKSGKLKSMKKWASESDEEIALSWHKEK